MFLKKNLNNQIQKFQQKIEEQEGDILTLISEIRKQVNKSIIFINNSKILGLVYQINNQRNNKNQNFKNKLNI